MGGGLLGRGVELVTKCRDGPGVGVGRVLRVRAGGLGLALALVGEGLGDGARLLGCPRARLLGVQVLAQLRLVAGGRLGRGLCRALCLLELGREFIGRRRGFGHGFIEFDAGGVERCPLGAEPLRAELDRCAPDLAGAGDRGLVKPLGQWFAYGLVVAGLRRFPCSQDRRDGGVAPAAELGADRGERGVLAACRDVLGGGDDAGVLIGGRLHGVSKVP